MINIKTINRLRNRGFALTLAAALTLSGLPGMEMNVYAKESTSSDNIIEEVLMDEDSSAETTVSSTATDSVTVDTADITESSSESDIITETSDIDTDNDSGTDSGSNTDSATGTDEDDSEIDNESDTLSSDDAESDTVTSDNSESDTVASDDAESTSGSGTITLSVNSGITDISFSEEGSAVTAFYNEETGVTEISVSESGEYTFTGSAVNTYITVDKKLSVTLNLSGLSIDNSDLSTVSGSDNPAISIGKNSEVVISTSGINTLKGSGTASEDPSPMIKAPSSTLTFTGDGTLSISNAGDDAIKAKSGTINIESGTINITDEIYGDGIQAENVNISGGEVNITTVFDNAATGYYTSGSSSTTLNTLTESGQMGTETKTEVINVNTGDHAGIKAGTKAATKIYPTADTETTEASGSLTISGGTVNIDTTGAGLKANSVSTSGYTACQTGTYIIGSPDDALHSNNDLTITGGTINIASSDDAISAAGNITISGTPVINIDTCYEGMEGSVITIGTEGASEGPDITINSNDDGINAAKKTNVTYTYTYDDNDDCYYTKTSTKSSGNSYTIYSGTVRIMIDSTSAKTATLRDGTSTKQISYRASGDGIDCNGTLNLLGGSTYVFGQSSGDNSPLDHDNGFTLSKDAFVLATGSSGMSAESVPNSGDGTYLVYGNSMQGGMPGGQSVPPNMPNGNTTDTTSGMNAPTGNTALPEFPGNNNSSFGMPGETGVPSGMPGNTTGFSGANMPGGAPGQNMSDGNMPNGAPGQNNESASTITAGSVFKVTSGDATLCEYTLPYSASFILYASPELADVETYTATLNGTEITMTKGTAGSNSTSTPGQPTNPSTPGQPTDPSTPGQPTDPSNPGQPTDPSTPGQPTDPSNPSGPVNPDIPEDPEVTEQVISGIDTGINVSKSTEKPDPASRSYTAEMVVGQKYTFGSGAWTTSDKKTLSVTGKTGIATAKKAGTVTITNTDSDITRSYEITVHSPALSSKKTTLNVGDTTEISINDTGNMPITWVSSNNAVFTVTASSDNNTTAVITAVGKGSARLTAYVGGKKYSATVVVKAASSGLVKSDIYLNAGKSIKLKHSGVTSKNLTGWTTDDESGIVTLINTNKPTVKIKTTPVEGVDLPMDVTLTCTTADKTLVTTLHIENPALTTDTTDKTTSEYGKLAQPKATALNYTLKLKVGDTYSISQPDVSQKVIWTSSASSKAFADEYGTITARAAGKSTLTAKINNKTVKIVVTVTE